jgi:FkbM family methyltransferase
LIRGTLRSTINRVSGNVRLTKRLPATFGRRRVVVTPQAYLRYWTATLGVIHADVLAIVDQLLRPGDCFWDIGANVGVLTFAAAQRVGRTGAVLAVEPDVDVCGLLHRSRRLAGQAEAAVDILPAAVADSVGISRFAISAHGSTTSSLEGYGRFPGVRVTRTVPTYTLDWLSAHFRPPALLKVDVEGAELLVLRGGVGLFRNCRPALLCEVGSDVAPAVGEFLREFEYLFYDARLPSDCRAAVETIPDELLAIPSERVVTASEFGPLKTTAYNVAAI